nr:hypothetical protein [Corynebacterium durum]
MPATTKQVTREYAKHTFPRADMDQLVGLVLDGLDDRRMTVSETEVEGARRAVHEFVAVLIADVEAFSIGDREIRDVVVQVARGIQHDVHLLRGVVGSLTGRTSGHPA